MPTPVTMPQLGESVTEGTVVKWLKREGEHVERDDPLFEVTTDKVNAEVPSPFVGVLARILVEEGVAVPIGAVVAEIQEHGVPRAAVEVSAHASNQAEGSDDTDSRSAQERRVTLDTAGAGERPRYSPVVRNLAVEHGIDLTVVPGTGLGGRVTKDDVLTYLARRDDGTIDDARVPENDVALGRVTRDMVLAYASEKTPTGVDAGNPRPADVGIANRSDWSVDASPTTPMLDSASTAQQDEIAVPLTAMRRSIAEHMARSKLTAPHATTVTEVDMTSLFRWRESNKHQFRARNGFDLTYVTFVIHAVLTGLRAFPLLNSSWGGDAIVLKKHLNIGVAVGLDDGLLVPVIHDADELSLVGIARAVADLADRARRGKLTVRELQGGTFTVNNTGAFGSIVSTPVINQPQAAILSMEAIVKRPMVIADAIAIRSMMNICLSFDHRIVDGLMAGRFNQTVKAALEQAVAVGQA
jgi:2-oxoisovalerate dehydrogenase E2 component (dihydrolipoyl transacylase)